LQYREPRVRATNRKKGGLPWGTGCWRPRSGSRPPIGPYNRKREASFDDALYPDLKGQWRRISPPGQPAFDPSKPRGWGQEAPLTEEYKKVFEENIRDLQAGGEGRWPGYSCRPPGMPPMMTAY